MKKMAKVAAMLAALALLFGAIIENEAFTFCKSLKSVTIPDGVTVINGGVFSDCTSLASVDMPDSVEYIGGSAFSNCSSLTSVDIPSNVATIYPGAFSSCTALLYVKIPVSVTTIGDNVFADCTSFEKVVYEGTVADWNTNIGQVHSKSIFKGTENPTIECTDGSITISVVD